MKRCLVDAGVEIAVLLRGVPPSKAFNEGQNMSIEQATDVALQADH